MCLIPNNLGCENTAKKKHSTHKILGNNKKSELLLQKEWE
jgi:hypothetical protein